MIEKIDNSLQLTQDLLQWEFHVPEAKKEGWHQRIIDVQRQYVEMRQAVQDKPSVAAYGESQMGKSYLISAMLGDRSRRFQLSDGVQCYDFIDEINPSDEGSQHEATGVVTRFLRQSAVRPSPEKGWLRVRLLSMADIILILAEAWCNETVHPAEDLGEYISIVEQRKHEILLQSSPSSNPFLSEIELAYIEKYLSEAGASFNGIVSSRIFPFLRQEYKRIQREDAIRLIKMVWKDNPDYNRLFDKLVTHREQLRNENECLVEFKSVLKKHGTLLAVERLGEMFSPNNSPEHITTVQIRRADGREISFPKSFLSALTSELEVDVDTANHIENRSFLDHFDILDFPGLKPGEEIKVDTLSYGANLATVFRRGKVSYLFKMYSTTKRISTLLFCQNHNDYNAGKLGGILEQWINTNIGPTPNERATVEQALGESPLLVISTWFNKNLEKNNYDPDKRWQDRFVRVLTNQVVKADGLPEHWFNNWIPGQVFKNIFLLRDFKYSNVIYNEPSEEARRKGDIEGKVKDDGFMSRLKSSFLSNSFVIERFGSDRANEQWDNAAEPNHDGTEMIISALERLAPKAYSAREQKFGRDMDGLKKLLLSLIDTEYNPDEPSSDSKKKKQEAARIVRSIDVKQGKEPLFFSSMLQSLAIPERLVRERVFSILKGHDTVSNQPIADSASQIISSAGIKPNDSKEVKLQKLCDYLGADDEKGCAEILAEEDIKIDDVLGVQQIMIGKAEQVVNELETLWLKDYLGGEVASYWRNSFAPIDTLVGKIADLWKYLNGHRRLTEELDSIMNRLADDRQVGIVSNWAAKKMQDFTCQFGYSWISDEQMQLSQKKNRDFGMGVNFELCDNAPVANGIELLSTIYTALAELSRPPQANDEHRWEEDIPEYRDRWQWEHRLRLAFTILSGLKNYDIKANKELGEIKEKIEKIA